MTTESARADFYQRVEHRINWLTPIVGMLEALSAYKLISLRAGAGVAIGAVLTWLHYMWLRQATTAVVREAAKQADAPKSSDSSWIVFKLLVGYVLIAIVAYVIVAYFSVPVYSVLIGLLALGAAAIFGSAYTVLFDNQ
jgi:hypothetical protein